MPTKAKSQPSEIIDSDKARSIVVSGAAARSIAVGAPTKGRGTAFPELAVSGQIAALFQTYAPLAYLLPFEVLDYIEILSTYNPDFSQAVDNVRTLSNSGHNLFIDSSAPRTSARIKARLEEKSRELRQRDGGVDGLIDQLLDDAAVYGATCGEWVPNDDLTDIIDFVRVNPKHIRFFWDDELADWAPFQKVNMIQQEEAKQRGQEVRNACVRLNENTFHYYAFDSAPGVPYGTPPFLAALPNIAIQRDMINNMAQIVKKVGLLGIIDLSIQALKPRPGESDSAFTARAEAFLDRYVVAIEDMVRDGGIAHFDDMQAKTYNITGNAAGATNIFKQNEELIFSGLKSMPSVQGRCVAPNTKVLTTDLEWVEAGKLCLGDELIGFDEDLGKYRGRGSVARMKRSVVECHDRIMLPCIKVTTDKGQITVSENHPFVVLGSRMEGRVWREARDLKPDDKLIWFSETWETDRSYDAGYLAGVFDGEGTIGRSGSGQNGTVTMAQLPGAVLDKTMLALKRLGFESTCSPPNPQSGVCVLRLRGGKFDTLRFLGSVRPHRLLPKAPLTWEGASLRNGGAVNQVGRKDVYATVQTAKRVGVKEVVALQTSSHTFISEGLLSHNSYSSTETYAGVAYDIIVRNTYKYQRAIKRMIEAGYWLMVMFWGETPTSIRLEFNSNKSLHRLQDAQAFRLEIFNAILLWAMGIIDQSNAAQILGFQEPKSQYDTPPQSQLLGSLPTVGIGAKGAEGAEGAGSTDSQQQKVNELVEQLFEVLSEMSANSVGGSSQ